MLSEWLFQPPQIGKIKLEKSSPNRAALFSLKVLQTKIIKTTFKFIYMVSGTFNPSGLDKKVIISSSWTSQAPCPLFLKRPKTKKNNGKNNNEKANSASTRYAPLAQVSPREWMPCLGVVLFGCPTKTNSKMCEWV